MTYKIVEARNQFDDDLFDFTLYVNDEEVGRLEIEALYDSYLYEFSNVLSNEEFLKEFRDEPIVKIARLEIDEKFRKNGYASYLLTESFKKLRLAGFTQWFLNASPLDDNAMTLEHLEEFYGRFGFKKKNSRDKSTLMWFKDDL